MTAGIVRAAAFEDALGAHLLTMFHTRASYLGARHDDITIINHLYAEQSIRVVLSLDRAFGALGPEWSFADPKPDRRPWGSALQTYQGQLVIPLAALDLDSRFTTHVTSESGDIVPLLGEDVVDRLVASGLVAFASEVIRGPMPPELENHLRETPRRAGDGEVRSRRAADQRLHQAAFDRELDLLADKSPHFVLPLMRDPKFMAALATAVGARMLVIAADPTKGPYRAFSFTVRRPLARDIRAAGGLGRRRPGSSHPSPTWSGLMAPIDFLQSLLRKLHVYVLRAGTQLVMIELGDIGGCRSYQLNVDAPFDTWFAEGSMYDEARRRVDTADTSHLLALRYLKRSFEGRRPAVLGFDLRSVYTGVARTSVWASLFLIIVIAAGFIRILVSKEHVLLAEDTDAGASLLLLFPGVAASMLATPAPHTLTATVQFPLRFTLWGLSFLTFVLASATAVGVRGIAAVFLWASVLMVTVVVGVVLRVRAAKLREPVPEWS